MALEDPQLTSAETVASSQPEPQLRPPSTVYEDEGRFVPGTLLNGRYRIRGLLGRGGMGEVYQATDLTLGQSVALKFLPEFASGNVRLLERFHGEVRIARQVSHPNVCRVHDIGEVDGAPFISMEYVDGEDLASLLQRIGRLPADKALETARKICAGLAAAHDKGVIHRDLKPQNIMLNKRGEVVIMDFGLAAVADSLSGAEARNGTPAYMAPEQLKGLEVTAKSDLYALGAVLFELFTGKRPYEARTVQSMIDQQDAMQLTGMTTLAPDLDPGVETVIRRCLDASPARRPPTALAVAAALPGGDPLAVALAAGETPSPEMVAAAGSNEGLQVTWAVGCLIVILACVLIAPYLRSQRLAMMQAPLRLPPDALNAKAREVAASLGYPRQTADSAGSFFNRDSLIAYLSAKGQRDWPAWMRAEAPLSYSYREALRELVAWPAGIVTTINPAPLVPGMTQIELDAHGRLRGFSGVPYSDWKAGEAPVEPEAVFRAVGLDATKFTETEPQTLPRTATERMRAWKGAHPDIPDVPLTLEIGWWRSQVTHVKVIWPWMNARGETVDSGSPIRFVRFFVMAAVMVFGAIFATLLAVRNWKLGRIDKRGAGRLALVQILLGVVAWAGSTHPATSGEIFDQFFAGVADSLAPAGVLWVLYLALEPALRARSPQSIVTWNRVLAGRFLDPQVASHVLFGIAIACIMWVGMNAALQTTGSIDTTNVRSLDGTRVWFAMVATTLMEAMVTGMIGFFVLFGLRTLVRKDWIAAIAAALIFAATERSLAKAADWQLRYVMYAIVYAALAFALLRLGLVVSISMIAFVNLLGQSLIGTNWTPWYTASGFATLGLILTVTAIVFWKSLGSRDLFGGGDESTAGSLST